MTKRWLGAALLSAGVGLMACVPIYMPRRDAVDHRWNEHMLLGRYGTWFGDREARPPRPWDDKIASSPVGAVFTPYGIEITDVRGLFAKGEWILTGGLIGRAAANGGAVELFAKRISFAHWPRYVTNPSRDSSYEFFLLVRPGNAARARVVKKWQFPSEQVAYVVDPQTEGWIRATAKSKEELEERLALNRDHNVGGELAFDPRTRVAIVTVTGLLQPFVETVDLTPHLGPGS